jgi:multidrug transporter EmrE-like cation transporter
LSPKWIAWSALFLAAFANLGANLSLKFAAKQVQADSLGALVPRLIKQPWTWVGIVCACMLFGSYVLAIRDLGLGLSYAVVTSLTLVLVTVTAAIAFQERLGLTTFIGIGLIIVGLAILVTPELSN